MMTLLITFSLNVPDHDYSKFIDAIESYPSKRLSKTSFVIKTNESPKDVFEILGQYLTKSDCVYIITLQRPYFGHGPQEINDWLKKELS